MSCGEQIVYQTDWSKLGLACSLRQNFPLAKKEDRSEKPDFSTVTVFLIL